MAKATELIDTIEALLPQTQCRQCQHDGCTPYAEALVNGEALNRCVPGGDPVARQLADLLQRPFEPVADAPAYAPWRGMVAFIIEDACIGCTKCIVACPVDAIVGAQRVMHTVIADECTGCELCLPPCPTDCIEMRPVPIVEDPDRARRSRARHDARERRIGRSRRAAVVAFDPASLSVSAPATTEVAGETASPTRSAALTPAPDDVVSLRQLETAALSAQKRWKDAAAALKIAQRKPRPDLDQLRARVADLEQRAIEARERLDAARQRPEVCP